MLTIAGGIVLAFVFLAALPLILPLLAIAAALAAFGGVTLLATLAASETITGSLHRPLSLGEVVALFILCGCGVAFIAWRVLENSIRRPTKDKGRR